MRPVGDRAKRTTGDMARCSLLLEACNERGGRGESAGRKDQADCEPAEYGGRFELHDRRGRAGGGRLSPSRGRRGKGPAPRSDPKRDLLGFRGNHATFGREENSRQAGSMSSNVLFVSVILPI